VVFEQHFGFVGLPVEVKLTGLIVDLGNLFGQFGEVQVGLFDTVARAVHRNEVL